MKKIGPKEVKKALLDQVAHVQAHLDLEGIAFIRVVRTGADECFAQDHTSETLQKGGLTYKEMQEMYWKKPACEKF